MLGSATLTIEASSTTTNCAAARSTSASQRRSVEAEDMKVDPWGGEVEVEFRFRLERYGIDVPVVKPYSRLMTDTAPRPLRADARRNRERVLVAARAAFAEHGREAQMDDVAQARGRRRRARSTGTSRPRRRWSTRSRWTSSRRCSARAREALEIEDPWEAFTTALWAGATAARLRPRVHRDRRPRPRCRSRPELQTRDERDLFASWSSAPRPPATCGRTSCSTTSRCSCAASAWRPPSRTAARTRGAAT